jgi:hypothetical protein
MLAGTFTSPAPIAAQDLSQAEPPRQPTPAELAWLATQRRGHARGLAVAQRLRDDAAAGLATRSLLSWLEWHVQQDALERDAAEAARAAGTGPGPQGGE